MVSSGADATEVETDRRAPRVGSVGAFGFEVGERVPVGHLEVVLSHPTGVAEVLEGSIVTGPTIVIDLHTTSVSLTSTAKSVSQLHRRFELDGDVLRYRLAMAAVGVPLTHHLTGELRRVV